MSNEELKRRRGRIVVPFYSLDNEIGSLIKGFEKILPYNVDLSYIPGSCTYWCFSEEFEEVEDGSIEPEYTIIMNKKTGKVKIEKLKDRYI